MSVESFPPAGEQAGADGMTQLQDMWRRLAARDRYRPAQDAADLRNLLASLGPDETPPDVLARVWRSLCGDAAVRAGVKAVYVGGGAPDQALEGARGFFGFGPAIVPVSEVRDALEHAEETPGALGCLPWPEIPGPGQWWPMLNENRFKALSIVGGWPCEPAGDDAACRMAVIARMPVEPSGNDDMLATAHDDSHTAERELQEAGFEGKVVARARSLTLMRLRGFVAPDDPRLDAGRRAGLEGFRIVGVLPRY
ncbi:MAG: hypothetical protein R3C52_12450 [Hyphomonadaceae bacterium]